MKGEGGKKPLSNISHVLLLARLNQSLQNKGLSVDVIEEERTGKQAICFTYHPRCNQNSFVQAKQGGHADPNSSSHPGADTGGGGNGPFAPWPSPGVWKGKTYGDKHWKKSDNCKETIKKKLR